MNFFTGVPDSLLNDFCNYIQNNVAADRHIIAANEGNAIAIAAGYNLATGSIPLVYMQNSGLGNSLNPLISLTNKEVFSIPMILLVGWRGDPSISDHVQHKRQGELTPVLLDDCDIPYEILEENVEQAAEMITTLVDRARESSTPVAVLVKKGVLSKLKKIERKINEQHNLLSREEAIEHLIQLLPDDARFVGTTGRVTRELFCLRDKHSMKHNLDFLNVGAMGHTSSIATGIALGCKDKTVVCLDGDAALIMHMGCLTTAGKMKLPNLIHIVLNNGVHESVGGQPSAGYISDLTAIAENSGYKTIGRAVESKNSIKDAVEMLLPSDKPVFLEIRIRKGIREDLGPLNVDHYKLKTIFMDSIIKEG